MKLPATESQETFVAFIDNSSVTMAWSCDDDGQMRVFGLGNGVCVCWKIILLFNY